MKLSERQYYLIAGFVLLAMLGLLYSVSLGHNFLFDEETIILKNPLIRGFDLLGRLFQNGYFYEDTLSRLTWNQYYRPLTSASFAVDYSVWGLNPLGYNLTNLLLHFLVCFLGLRLFRKILNDRLSAFLAILLFCVHTLHTEAVTYLASRGDLLGALFTLAAILFYLDNKIRYALMATFIGFWCKESAVLIPFYLVLATLSFQKLKAAEAFKRLAPFFILAAAFLLFRRYGCPVPPPPVDNVQVSLLRVFSMGLPLIGYGRALLFPESFKFCEDIAWASSFFDLKVFITVALYTLGAVLIWISYRKNKSVFFGLGVISVGLLPYLHYVHFKPEWSEHYLYLSSLGAALLVGSACLYILRAKKNKLIIIFFVLLATAFIYFCARTWERNAVYKNTLRYYSVLSQSRSPYAYYGYENLARIQLFGGNLAGAKKSLDVLARLAPNRETTYGLFGAYAERTGEYPKARRYFQKAFLRNRSNALHLTNAAVVLIKEGRYTRAIALLKRAQAKAPDHRDNYLYLMNAYELNQDPTQGLAALELGLNRQMIARHRVDAATLVIAAARLAFRERWHDKFREYVQRASRDYPDVYWYGDVAGFWAGRLSAAEFISRCQKKYPGFDNDIRLVLLINYSERNERAVIDKFFKENTASLDQLSQQDPLIKKEFRVLKQNE